MLYAALAAKQSCRRSCWKLPSIATHTVLNEVGRNCSRTTAHARFPVGIVVIRTVATSWTSFLRFPAFSILW